MTDNPMELVHMDVCGPFQEASMGGSVYLATFLDDFSGLSVVCPIKAKSDVAGVTMDVINMLEKQSGWPLLVVRTDNGSEYINSTLATFFKEKGVIHQTTVRYTPEQNGKAERLNRTLLDRVRAMLEDSKLPKTLWAEAATTANYLRNRAPAAGRSCTPWEAFFGKKPDVSHLRVFGARAYALQPKELRRKLDSHAIRGVMVGYEPNVKGYRILTDDGKIIVAGDVAFDETTDGARRPGTASVAPKEHVHVAVDSDGSGSDGEDNDAAADGDADQATSDDGADHVAPPRRYPTIKFSHGKFGEGGARTGRSALTRATVRCINRPPPVSAPTVNGFFPHLRWVFYAELISEALTRYKTVAGVTDQAVGGGPELLRRMKRRPLRSLDPPALQVSCRDRSRLAREGTLALTGICSRLEGMRRSNRIEQLPRPFGVSEKVNT
jgi:hypothetical protein